jgi:L-Ala-D/L-Glu epimerase / N-acetyl-D-glutamate racemase
MSALRVRSLETFPVGLPFRRPYVTATGTLDRREMIVVRIRSTEGAVGYGDAVPMSLRGGPGLDTVRSDLADICAPLLTDIDFDLESGSVKAIPKALARCRDGGAGAQALSAVDIALLDLIGKSTGLPAWRLLGASRAEPVVCNGTLGADEPTAAAEQAAAMCREGFGTLKVKVGSGPDFARIGAVRAASGPETNLRIDANGAWGAREAMACLADLEPLRIELVEQPCRKVEDLAEVRAATGMRIVADESVNDLDDATNALSIGAIDAATLKLAKVGGVHTALEIGAAVPAYLSSALDSALGIAAAAHTTQALFPRQFASGLAHGLATSGLFADNVADDANLQGPSIALGEAPGLGVEVDEQAIERLRIR